MTLIVSLPTTDGIVIAGDSLATIKASILLKADVDVVCPNCQHAHTVVWNAPSPSLPTTTFAFAQKVFPFLGKYGIGTFGTGILVSKSIYFIIRELEQQLLSAPRPKATSARGSSGSVKALPLSKPNTVSDVASAIGKHMHALFLQQLAIDGRDPASLQTGAYELGFHVVGYDNGVAVRKLIFIGKDLAIKETTSPTECAYNGQTNVVQAIRRLYADPMQAPAFELFSLQDAISYAEFLIRTTAAHQDFSSLMPSVGGDIDVGLVTPFTDFKWIKRKELSKILEG